MPHELNLTLRPEWEEVEQLNQQAMDFLHGTGMSSTEVDTYTMVICELAENSIKYGDSSEPIHLHVRVRAKDVSVQVKNKVRDEAQGHLRELDQTLQWIRGVQDPYQAYLERIRELSREPIANARSCLGLIRVMYEGRSDVDFVLDDNTLNVSAQSRAR
ncbi:hypothetical protein [Aquisalimonas asiatica]|uniref:Histidine kinase-like ATPase domain-containing protein n=1 Tax=Aquisalimonas asiatica TaxID=406100 RepID=A0A1H8SN12_9GAMM|nr:hypothetical protein [Aquisalimonas asiatica]SEO80021.1 hypothetical protein SAMN04488052_10383 [Aquisalimonas asiatica]